jgi:hypothetical protein
MKIQRTGVKANADLTSPRSLRLGLIDKLKVIETARSM